MKNPIRTDIMNDGANNAISSGVLGVASSTLPTAANPLTIQNKLDGILSDTVAHWAQTTDAYNKFLFGGTPQATTLLKSMITGGAQLVSNLNSQLDGTSLWDVQGSMQAILYGKLIPQAWTLSPQAFTPVIM